MPLRQSPDHIALAFSQLSLPDPAAHHDEYSYIISQFVENYFEPVENDLMLPTAVSKLLFQPPPRNWLPCVQDPSVQKWAHYLHHAWSILCRQATENVKSNPKLHTLLPVPGPFIMPGARFREGYYWDSYWAVRGLLICGLNDLAINIVLNLVHCVETYGFVPNGLRSYYLNRSQPPLLACMVEAVYDYHCVHPCSSSKTIKNSDIKHETLTEEGETEMYYYDFLARCVCALDKELTWWRENRTSPTTYFDGNSKDNEPNNEPNNDIHDTTDDGTAVVSRYCAAWNAPRPESFKEDVATANESIIGAGETHNHANQSCQESAKLYRDIASAAESGWDFSSRWFSDGQSLSTIRTTHVLPADLNAILFKAETITAKLAGILEKRSSTGKGFKLLNEKWTALAKQRKKVMDVIFWDARTGRWRDRLLTNDGDKTHRLAQPTDCIYASDFIPLWCGCAEPHSRQAMHAISSLKSSGLMGPAGIAASNTSTGQQWDWPNVWPPLQSMLGEGCEAMGDVTFAREIAQTYLRTAYSAWKATGRMFEKFDARTVGARGGGGEYDCMDGFGWTNGVALMWLDKFGFSENE